LENDTDIGVGNISVRYNDSDATVTSYNFKYLGTSRVNIGSYLSNGTTQYLKFFLNVPYKQTLGVYNSSIDIDINITHGT